MISILRDRWVVDQALFVCAAVSALLLAGAHAFETFGRMVPCALCLDQREAHWTGLTLALIGLALGMGLKARRAAAATVGACALVYVVSSGFAFFHVGVEHHFWPGPASCSGGGPVTISPGGLGEALGQKPSGPSCADAPWALFGVSMAGFNLLASAGLAAFCFIAAFGAVRVLRTQSRAANSGA